MSESSGTGTTAAGLLSSKKPVHPEGHHLPLGLLRRPSAPREKGGTERLSQPSRRMIDTGAGEPGGPGAVRQGRRLVEGEFSFSCYFLGIVHHQV